MGLPRQLIGGHVYGRRFLSLEPTLSMPTICIDWLNSSAKMNQIFKYFLNKSETPHHPLVCSTSSVKSRFVRKPDKFGPLPTWAIGIPRGFAMDSAKKLSGSL